jgi:hypothetical protein
MDAYFRVLGRTFLAKVPVTKTERPQVKDTRARLHERNLKLRRHSLCESRKFVQVPRLMKNEVSVDKSIGMCSLRTSGSKP